MPKKTAQRIIDSRRANRATSISGLTLTAPAGVTDHGALSGLGDDDHTQYLLADGSRALSGNLTVAASVTIDGVDISAHAANASAHHAPVTAGTLIALSGQQVGIATGANYQFVGTGAGTAAAWQNLSGLAGNGLTHASGVLAVGAGDGLTVGADAIALTTPGTLTAATTNSSAANHTHAMTTGAASTLSVATSNATGSSASLARADHLHTITSSSNPGAAASILASSAAGLLQLVQVASNTTFVSGFAGSGYRIDYGVSEAAKASAEVDNLTVRGRMRVYELLIQQIRATNGSVFVSSSSKVVTVTADANPLWTVNGTQLTFNGTNANLTTTLYVITTSTAAEASASRTHYHGFLSGDVIRAQQVLWNGSAFAGVIQSNLEVTGVTNLYTYQAALVSGDAPAAGYDYVRLGSATNTTRQGSIYLTSDDSNAPFVDIVDAVREHADWNTAGKTKVRLGKLSGITDAYFGTLGGYGLYSDNVYLRGSIYATSGYFKGTVYAEGGMFNGTVYATDGAFTGTITATAGTIGGWTVDATKIVKNTGTAATSAGLAPADYPFYAGATYANRATAPFRVTPGGALTATSGTVGGWTLAATALTAGSGGTTVGLDTGGTNPAIYAGSATPGSAPFRVTNAGALTATGVDVTGKITASSGSFTGALTIGTDGGIYQGSGTFASPTTGLKIWNDGGVGRIGGYNGGTLEWYASTTGRIYSGRGTMRLGYDDIRLKHEDSFTDMRTVKWVENIDFTGDIADLASTNGAYAYMGAYTNSGGTLSELYISNRVNNTGTPAQTQNSQISLTASRNESGSIYYGTMQLVCFGSTYNYESGVFFSGTYLRLGSLASTPTFALTSSKDAQIYIKGGNLIVRYNDGGTYRYKYLNLAGTGSGWAHSTTAP